MTTISDEQVTQARENIIAKLNDEEREKYENAQQVNALIPDPIRSRIRSTLGLGLLANANDFDKAIPWAADYLAERVASVGATETEQRAMRQCVYAVAVIDLIDGPNSN